MNTVFVGSRCLWQVVLESESLEPSRLAEGYSKICCFRTMQLYPYGHKLLGSIESPRVGQVRWQGRLVGAPGRMSLCDESL
jgi:hypothetical protein